MVLVKALDLFYFYSSNYKINSWYDSKKDELLLLYLTIFYLTFFAVFSICPHMPRTEEHMHLLSVDPDDENGR